MFDLPPGIYDRLQKLVHGDYSKSRKIIDELRLGNAGKILEIGCGTGLLSTAFEQGEYVGTDNDATRIERAKASYPEHEFFVMDFTNKYATFLEQFDIILYHNCIHHIDDKHISRMLVYIREAVMRRNRPINLIIIEPIIPESIIRNPLGYALAKLDRGKYVRNYDEMINLIKGIILSVRRINGKWYWPVPGIGMNVLIT